MTHTNLNFTLCGCSTDPIEKVIGKWYYVFSEVYIFIGGEIFHRLIKVFIKAILKIKGMFIIEKIE
jgi:hypothetical protein